MKYSMTTRLRHSPAMLSLVTMLCVLSGAAYAQEQSAVRVGVLAPLSGPFEMLGRQIEQGVTLALQRAASTWSFDVIAVDDACEEETGRDAANQLIGAQVDLVIGGVCWRPASAAAAVLSANQIPFYASGVRYPGLTDEGLAGVFRINGRDDDQGRFLADAIASGLIDPLIGGSAAQRPIVLLYTESTYGRPLAEAVRDGLDEAGITLALYEPFDAQSGMDRAAVRAQAEDPGLVVVLAGQADTALVVSALRERLSDVAIVTGDSALTAEFPLLASDAAHGVVLSRPTAWRGVAVQAQTERVAQLEADVQQALFGLILPSFAATQVALAQLAAGVASGQSAPIETILGPLTFAPNGDAELPSFELWQWRDGAIWPFEPPIN